MNATQFSPTHEILLGSTRIPVQVVDQVAYTREEWQTDSAADWEIRDDGVWTFQGRVPGGPYTVVNLWVASLTAEEGPELARVLRLSEEATAAGDHALALVCDRAAGRVVLDEDLTVDCLYVAKFMTPKQRAWVASLTDEECASHVAKVLAEAKS